MKKIILLLFIAISITSLGQNKLDKSKKELNAGSGENKQSSSRTRNSSGSSKSSYNSDTNLFVDIFVNITFGIFKYGVIGDYNNEDHLYNTLTKYPYYNGNSGNYESSDTLSGIKNKARIDLENSFVYNSNNLFGNHLKTKIRPFQYFYLQTDFHQLFEFNDIDQKQYRLSLFQFNLNYDRIRFEKFNFGWNLGATYIGNEVKKAGLSYGVNAEYFMGNRVSFLAAAKWSQINTLPVNSFEIQSKFHRKNYFFLLGFEHLKIATPTYNLIALGGGIYF
jgi:hypothetical protein